MMSPSRQDRQESQRRVRAGKKANVSRQEENVKDSRLRVIGFRPAANATEHRAPWDADESVSIAI